MRKLLYIVCSIIVIFLGTGCHAESTSMIDADSSYIIHEENNFRMVRKVSTVNGQIQTTDYCITHYLGNDASVTLPTVAEDGISISSIDDFAFAGHTCIEEVIIPKGYTKIEENAFYNCTQLQKVSLPSTLVEISPYTVFGLCPMLKDIQISDENPVYLSDGNCIIEKYTNKLILGCGYSDIPSYVEVIGTYAFSEVRLENTIEIPTSVHTIEERAFFGCENLNVLAIGRNVKKIGRLAFGHCTNLTIYCSFFSKPEGWDIYWISLNDQEVAPQVVWLHGT